MLSKMKETEQGSRIASVHNGSALFTGDAGQGESEIRKHIIESDMLEAIIALPNDIFYNTGIPTYIFVMTNRKPENKKKNTTSSMPTWNNTCKRKEIIGQYTQKTWNQSNINDIPHCILDV
jgi:type I restriction-modification system DNA methylase subunit